MRKVLGLAIAVVALSALTGVALAQYTLPNITLDARTTPVNAGTKKKPKKGIIRFTFTISRESRVTPDQIALFAPRHVLLSGRGFRFCPSTQINTNGVTSCPRRTRIGAGTATAVVGPRQLPLNFNVQVFWGAIDELVFYLEQVGGNLKIALSAPISDAGAPYGQKITIDIPQALQQIERNVYTYFTGFDVRISGPTVTRKVRVRGKRRARRYASVYLFGCPRDRTHDYLVRLRFVPNPDNPPAPSAEQGDTSACRR